MAPSREELLHGPLLKIKWANDHIGRLDAEIKRLVSEGYFVLKQSFRPKTGETTIRSEAEKPIPPELSLMIGDSVHNLRAALDILMYSFAKDRSPKPWRIEFPFPRENDGLKKSIDKAHIKFAGTKVVDEVTRLDPRPDGNKLLYELHRLDVRDKHHVLVLARHTPIIKADELRRMTGLPIFGSGSIRYIGPEGGEVFTTVTQPNASGIDRDQKTDVQPAFSVAFGVGEPCAGQPVISTLNECSSAVERAVASLIDAFLDPKNTFP